ncbi:MAG: FCD domain-containing protein [Tetrasphaera sp.]
MHEQVQEQIEQQIINGTLRSGDRLPSERTLTELLEVSRQSVREALRILESIGVIEATGTRGADAGWVVSDDTSPALGRLLQLQMALSRFDLTDLMETRIRLERWAAQLAAANADEDRIGAAERLVDAMEDEALAPRDFNRLDTEFHQVIAKASGNRLLTSLMQALRDAVEREMVSTVESIDDWEDVVYRLRHEHRALIDAISAGDGDEAADLVETHIREFYKQEMNNFLHPKGEAGAPRRS